MDIMIIQISVKPNSKQLKLEKIGDNTYKAWLTVVPEKGKANKQLIELLSEFFAINKSRIKIKAGLTSREKLIEINRKQ